MASLLPNGRQQFIDANGNPVVNGTVEHYVPSTTTPKTTWQDQSQTVPNTNPITLDSYGQATIWGSGSYRQILKDSSGNLIWDKVVSDISADINTLSSNLSNKTNTTLGAKLIGYLLNAAGAVGRWLSDKLAERVSVKDFGAVGDGVTDDTAAFQAALDFANSVGGAVIRVPRGTYQISATLNIYKNTSLIGEGSYLSRLNFSHTGKGIASTWPINSSTQVSIRIEKLWLVSTNPATADGGIVDTCGTFITIHDVQVSSFKYGVVLNQSELVTIKQLNVAANGITQIGLWLTNGADYTPGASTLFTNGIWVYDCQFIASNTTGIAIVDDGGSTHSFERINFGGWTSFARFAGVYGLTTKSFIAELCGGNGVVFTNTTYTSATVVGVCNSPLLENHQMTGMPAAVACVKFFAGVGNVSIIGGLYRTGSAVPAIQGVGLINNLDIRLAYNDTPGGTLIDSAPVKSMVRFDDIDMCIKFANTTNSDSTTLDWVKKGTVFTPSLTFGGGNTGMTLSTAYGRYTRIGDVVFCAVTIILSAKGASVGAAQITGLPFTSGNIAHNYSVSFGDAANLSGLTGALGGQVAANTTVINLKQLGAAGYSALTDANFTNTSNIQLSFFYTV